MRKKIEKVRSKKNTFEEKFGAREYIETYYPNDLKLKDLLNIAKFLKSAYSKSDRFDLKNVSQYKRNVNLEMVENIAIFDFHRKVLGVLFKEFPQGNARVLDVGGGPTIYQHIMLSLITDRIVHSEFLEKNRQEVMLWLRKEETAYTWDLYFELAQEMLRKDKTLTHWLKTGAVDTNKKIKAHARKVQRILNTPSVDLFKHQVRKSIGDKVVHGDVFKENLDLPQEISSLFDIVTASFVVEGATGNRMKYNRGLKNVLKRIKPGGFFVHASVRNATWYQVGEEQVPATPVNEEDIKNICIGNGYSVLFQRLLVGSNKRAVGYDGMIFTLAKKLIN